MGPAPQFKLRRNLAGPAPPLKLRRNLAGAGAYSTPSIISATASALHLMSAPTPAMVWQPVNENMMTTNAIIKKTRLIIAKLHFENKILL